MTCCLRKFLWNFSFILLGILSDRWVQTEMFREGQFLLCVFCLPAWLVGCIAFVSVQWLAESLACFFLCVCAHVTVCFGLRLFVHLFVYSLHFA